MTNSLDIYYLTVWHISIKIYVKINFFHIYIYMYVCMYVYMYVCIYNFLFWLMTPWRNFFFSARLIFSSFGAHII